MEVSAHLHACTSGMENKHQLLSRQSQKQADIADADADADAEAETFPPSSCNLFSMHTPLAPHLHTEECNRIIARLLACHAENSKLQQLFGACNELDTQMR